MHDRAWKKGELRGGSRIFEGGGVHLRSTSKKGGGSKRGGPTLGPMLKRLHRGPKGGGGPGPLPPPPGSATGAICKLECMTHSITSPDQPNIEKKIKLWTYMAQEGGWVGETRWVGGWVRSGGWVGGWDPVAPPAATRAEYIPQLPCSYRLDIYHITYIE